MDLATIVGLGIPFVAAGGALAAHRFSSPRRPVPVKKSTIPYGLRTTCKLIGQFYASRDLPTGIHRATMGYRTSQIIYNVPPDIPTKKIENTQKDLEHYLSANGVQLVKGSLMVEVSGKLFVSFTHTAKRPVLLSKLLRVENPYDDSFIIGVDMQDKIFRLPVNIGSYPHTMIVGSTGSGKTFLVLTIAINAIMLGWDIWILNPKKRPLKDEIGLWSLEKANNTTYITDYEDMEVAMEKLVGGMENLKKPTMIIADELADILSARKGVAEPIGRIAQRGRQYRLHLVAVVPKATKSVLVDDMLHANVATALIGMRMNSRNLSMFGTGIGGLQLDKLAGEGHAKVKLGSEITEIQVALPDNVGTFVNGDGGVYRDNELLPIVQTWIEGIQIGGPVSKDRLRRFASGQGKGLSYQAVSDQFDLLVEMGRIEREHDNVPGVKVQ